MAVAAAVVQVCFTAGQMAAHGEPYQPPPKLRHATTPHYLTQFKSTLLSKLVCQKLFEDVVK